MDSGNYMTLQELSEVARLIEYLNEVKQRSIKTTLGPVEVFDANGDRLGFVMLADGEGYVLAQDREIS